MISDLSDMMIGDWVIVGYKVLLYGCCVEDECLIGMGVILLDNVYVGYYFLIGVGLLVL